MRRAADRSSTGESELLRRKVKLVLPALRRATATFVTRPDIKGVYPEFLIACHFVVRASVPLMESALARASDMDDDAVASGLSNYLPTHIDEERDHDRWVLEDLESLGVDRAAFLMRPPSSTIAALVGAQYYWIHHYHPVALMGYIAVLEGYPTTREAIAELRARTGYDERAFRSLVEHAELDPHHFDEFNETLDRLPLSPEQSAVVGLSAMHTVVMLARAFDEIVDGSADGSRA